jgi:uncharacterized membrane protein (DUF2068 family)
MFGPRCTQGMYDTTFWSPYLELTATFIFSPMKVYSKGGVFLELFSARKL